MANFDEILQNLHVNEVLSDTEKSTPIKISGRRVFEISQDYNTVLGYAGDVNSQIVTFELPITHESHNLSLCQYKKLKWKNLRSGAEGVSDLTNIEVGENTWTAAWNVPPKIMTISGQIEIAISLYDKDDNDDLVAFSWNTPSFKGFSIGEGFAEVADVLDENNLPAQDEIIVINTESRGFVIPNGYNTTVCNYGDIGISKVFFEINQYIRGIDLLGEQTKIYVGVSFITNTVQDFKITNIRPMFQSLGNKKESKLLLTWDIPQEITTNEEGYIGNFAISIKVEVTKEENEITEYTKRWTTSILNRLNIGSSGILNDVIELASRDETILNDAVKDVIDNYLEDSVVDNAVETYFENNEFVIEDKYE